MSKVFNLLDFDEEAREEYDKWLASQWEKTKEMMGEYEKEQEDVPSSSEGG